ncbi:MAG: ABC transporter ATP-binding protein/permease [Clostridia bacterium]|nr:ABC transporter ATP-binding protein/permease [Clostridia bacterium]
MKKKEKTKLIDATVRRLVRETKPIRWYLLLSTLLCCGVIACAVAAPELLGGLIDKLIDYFKSGSNAPMKDVLLPGLFILMGVYVLQSAFTYGNSVLLNNVVSRFFTCTLRIRISDKLQRLPVSYMDKTPTGDIIDRMQEDVSSMGNTIHGIIETLVTGFLQIIVISVFMFLQDWRLALLVVLLTPISLLLSSKLATKSETYWHKSFDYFGRMYSAVEEGYTNFPATKAFNLEHYIESKHDKINAEHQDVAFRGYFYADIVQPIITFSNAIAYILIALAGGWLIIYQGVKVGTIVTIILFARQFSAPLERIASGFSQMEQTKAAASRVFKILDTPEEERKEQTAGLDTGNVRFEQVDFSYDPEKPLIEDLSFDVKPGQNVAIVGPTGAGKTTIVNLLMRFYDISGGRILIDGQNIAEYSRDSTRDLFGMVLQDTWLFKGSVADNVAYGKPDATREEIIAACDMAYCDHFIRTLPQGYDTEVSEDSNNISAGQKQLLTIARAVLADRKLLILDEATSNVDTRTEILIQKAMDNLMKDKTCFVIAHRLSTIVDSDLILVLDHGKIVEQGRHQELLEKKGFYYRIYTSQYAI